jgi:hypothetical protein
MKTLFFILITIVFLLAGCSKDNELGKSVFISDTQYPDLPEYSEWGYNTFGAYYDRQAFISNDNIVPAKCIVTNNVMSFVLSGQLGAYSYYADANSNMSLTFQISGFLPADYKPLVQLNDTTLDLRNTAYKVFVTIGAAEDTATVIEGNIQFKRAQNLVVDTKQVEVILSGYFDLKVLINNEPITISNGRFDVGIGDNNFYAY